MAEHRVSYREEPHGRLLHAVYPDRRQAERAARDLVAGRYEAWCGWFPPPEDSEYRRHIASLLKRDDTEANFAAVFLYNDSVRNNRMRVRVQGRRQDQYGRLAWGEPGAY